MNNWKVVFRIIEDGVFNFPFEILETSIYSNFSDTDLLNKNWFF